MPRTRTRLELAGDDAAYCLPDRRSDEQQTPTTGRYAAPQKRRPLARRSRCPGRKEASQRGGAGDRRAHRTGRDERAKGG